MSEAQDYRIERCDLAQAVDFMRAGDWILRVLDPQRPPRREITDWAKQITEARGVSDPVVAERMIRPRSALAGRLAEHVATIMSNGDAWHERAAEACIFPEVPLRLAILAVVDTNGVLPSGAVPEHLRMAIMSKLKNAAGGLALGHQALRSVFSECATERDEVDTERALLAQRVGKVHRAASFRPALPLTGGNKNQRAKSSP